MILKRYNDPSYVFNLPYDYGMELILKAHDKDLEERAWELWLTFDAEAKQQTSYKDLLDEMKKPKVVNTNTRTDDEILKDAEYIINLLKRSE